MLHRTIFNGRFGNFIRIVFCTHVIYFRKKKLPKPKYCSFDIQLLLKVYVIMPKRRADAQSVQPFVFAYPTTTIILLLTDRTKTKAEAFTFNVKKPQQEKRAHETFEASSSPSPTNWWAKNARGDDVLTEPTTHRRKRIQVSRVCWDCVDVVHSWCWRLEWANQRARSTVMLWQLNPFYISKAD